MFFLKEQKKTQETPVSINKLIKQGLHHLWIKSSFAILLGNPHIHSFQISFFSSDGKKSGRRINLPLH